MDELTRVASQVATAWIEAGGDPTRMEVEALTELQFYMQGRWKTNRFVVDNWNGVRNLALLIARRLVIGRFVQETAAAKLDAHTLRTQLDHLLVLAREGLASRIARDWIEAGGDAFDRQHALPNLVAFIQARYAEEALVREHFTDVRDQALQSARLLQAEQETARNQAYNMAVRDVSARSNGPLAAPSHPEPPGARIAQPEVKEPRAPKEPRRVFLHEKALSHRALREDRDE